MHAQQYLNLAEHEQVAPIYVLYGSEAFFIQQVIDKIEYIVKNHDQQFDKNTYDMETIPVEEAILDAESFPLFSESKLVIINRAYFLTGQSKKVEVEHTVEVLEDYAKNPAPFSTVVIVAPYEKLDSRKKIVKTLKELCMMIECTSPKAYEMHNFINDMASSLHLKIDDRISELLIERVGEKLDVLRHELEKLSLYFGEHPFTYDEAEKLISIHSEASTFSLIDAITELNLSHSLNIIKELRKRNEEPIALLALIVSQIRLILQCKLLKNKGYQQQQITKQLQVHPYAVKMAMKREVKFSTTNLKNIMMEAAITDEALKTGQLDKWLAIELYIERVIRQLKSVS